MKNFQFKRIFNQEKEARWKERGGGKSFVLLKCFTINIIYLPFFSTFFLTQIIAVIRKNCSSIQSGLVNRKKKTFH